MLTTNFSKFDNGCIFHPVIYAIFNMKEKKYYVGKTMNAVPNRWHCHIYRRADTSQKMRDAMNLYSLTDWAFFILEEVEIPDSIELYTHIDFYLTLRENEWIENLDSIDNGYNSAMRFNPLGYRNFDEKLKEFS